MMAGVTGIAGRFHGASHRTYKEAVLALNELQTPGGVMKKIVQSGRERAYPQFFQKALKYTKSVGLEDEHLNSLNVIHISGTKGKGSTGAFCESILRHCGLKTGFFSSPHLVELRERIIVDGKPLPKEKFTEHFWDCYGMVDAKKDLIDGEFPGCFGFLTLMAFSAFLAEKVDVAIMEVGVGGEYDPTNVIRKPVVCGVTNLEYDHVEVLGETLGEIAWHKAGIFKPGIPAYTVPQKDEALQVIKQRAQKIGVSFLGVVPQWKDYNKHIDIGMSGAHQQLNASLAIQLCHRWLIEKKCLKEHLHIPDNICTDVSDSFKNGIEQCKWPGRQQVVYRDHVTYYLDGAHTNKSTEACSDWFKSAANEEAKKLHGSRVARVLLFNLTGYRKSHSVLLPLKNCDFDYALFCPNVTDHNLAATEDIDNLGTNTEEVMEESILRCIDNEQCWKGLDDNNSHTMQFPCAREAMDWVNNKSQEGVHLQVLVCGSIRLIGAVMWQLQLNADNLYN